ncbi:hypothetical protein [Pseudonocardia zijingensis]|uniref:Uncharacterized protein n=1 Tax=Pseudonocardia zijingensis TaxID=153376 RepID=A0ABN1PEK5_9PSEU
MTTSAARPSTSPAPEYPVHRSVVAHVTGGLDGVLRVATVLRGRRYRVRDLAVDIREGVVVSEVRATVLLTASETTLLLERLRRLASVTSADG